MSYHWVSVKANQLKINDNVYFGAYLFAIEKIIPLLENNLRLELKLDSNYYLGINPPTTTWDVFKDQYVIVLK